VITTRMSTAADLTDFFLFFAHHSLRDGKREKFVEWRMHKKKTMVIGFSRKRTGCKNRSARRTAQGDLKH
ncbi:unnamed protein product, partial [Thlaspi arvense]